MLSTCLKKDINFKWLPDKIDKFESKDMSYYSINQ